jgi:hypothetical protein
VAIDSGRQAISLLATRHPAIELLFYLFKLRPDLDTLVVEQALEVPGILKIFRQKEMSEAGVKAVEIKKFITCIGRMCCIRVLDLSIVKSGPKPQVTKHKENYAVLVL